MGLALLLLSGGAQARVVGGVPMHEALEVEGHALRLNGAAHQRVLFFDVYTLGLYLETTTSDPAEIIRSDQVKRLQLTVLRDLPRSMVVKALRGGIKRSVGTAQMVHFEDRLKQLTSQLRDPRKKDSLVITYMPGVGTILQEGSTVRAVIPGKEFADALFSIWLGPNSDSPRVRAALLAR